MPISSDPLIAFASSIFESGHGLSRRLLEASRSIDWRQRLLEIFADEAATSHVSIYHKPSLKNPG